jgi:hypothetical protein
VFNGKQYNRDVRLHKLVCEALIRLAWTQFFEWLETNHSQHYQNLDETLRLVNDDHKNPCETTFVSFLNDENVQDCLGSFHHVHGWVAILQWTTGFDLGDVFGSGWISPWVNARRSRGWLVTPLGQQTENDTLEFCSWQNQLLVPVLVISPGLLLVEYFTRTLQLFSKWCILVSDGESNTFGPTPHRSNSWRDCEQEYADKWQNKGVQFKVRCCFQVLLNDTE